MKNICKIVQDLLPTYIENITSNESNEFIKEHLENCVECNKIYENMIDDIEKENLENTEIVKQIKKYKNRINIIKFIVILVIATILLSVISSICYRFYIVNKAYEKNTNYKTNGNFKIEEYKESIENYDNHYTTYYLNGKMKKIYGDSIIEYCDGEKHYYFNNENMTYYMENVKHENNSIYIDISVLNGTNNILNNYRVNKLEILKFVLLKENIIKNEGFRNQDYYIIKDEEGNRVYVDKDTFLAQRVEGENRKDYRIQTSCVTWREIKEPDFSKYTLLENKV